MTRVGSQRHRKKKISDKVENCSILSYTDFTELHQLLTPVRHKFLYCRQYMTQHHTVNSLPLCRGSLRSFHM